MNPADPASVIALTQASLQVKKNKTEVLRILDDALANSPDSPELIATYGLYAETLLNNAQIAEAMYRRSIEINPKNPTTINNLASLIENVNRTEASRLYNMALALGHFDVLCRLRSISMEVQHFGSGGDCSREEDREKAAGAAAAKLLTTALTLEPNNAHVLLNFGALMEDWAENYALAKEIYRKVCQFSPMALRIDPENLNAVAYFSRTLRKEGQYEKATAILKRSLAKHPSDNTLRRELWRVNAQIKIENEKKVRVG
ncbi:hypothetical protein GUITHDRAFT_109051 [Guillardia theta CCMP2712]|uniref:Tetratricopeptide repeat protein n=1 Tax=Guillardia theta (strain CCMP2712) TaxID=905079 RepID=L1J9K6_GUITC|nr:hypothetical protein GUITHDRAFT_109051 [Guillardia theta CCMP2712]EKX45007.1 hypothetical protein GUITHDRAFT_109051 [Guillardia theta CCMP2712]|eukprot:XP_005831987.1 hypothetical protein GUITHDRAFT_109051 [Guillardia theta CCMP2712]